MLQSMMFPDNQEGPALEPVEDKGLVVLLDLNFTLVANSHLKRAQPALTYSQKIGLETYRQWLVELVRGHTVLLCTVRHQRYAEQTMQRISDLTGWQPEGAYFNATDNWNGYVVKRDYLERAILPAYGVVGETRYAAIESAAATRAMYASLGIPAEPVPRSGRWRKLPFTA